MMMEATRALIIFAVVALSPLLALLWILKQRPHRNIHWIALLVFAALEFVAMYFGLRIGFVSNDPNIQFLAGISVILGVMATVLCVTAYHLRNEIRSEAEKAKQARKNSGKAV